MAVGDPDEDTITCAPVDQFADLLFARPRETFPISFGAASHVGRVRTRNEDHFAVVRLRRAVEIMRASLERDDLAVADTYSYAMVVADGMGGMKAGELASRMALQTMLELAGQATSWVMKITDPNAQQVRERIEAYVQRIQRTIYEHGRSDPAATDMGTTWTSAHLLGDEAVIVHLGDSRAYRIRDGQLGQITTDETLAQSFIDAGMDAKDVKRYGHILLNSFGGKKLEVSAQIHHLRFAPGDQLLLCSDGLTDMVPDQQIADELGKGRPPQEACDALVECALANGGKDNVTVVLALAQEPM
jgi:serine/threonine protein phosphatase PrpC